MLLPVWAIFLFARRYSGNLIRFLFLQVLRWFSSLHFAGHGLCIQPCLAGIQTRRVSPFGNLRVVTPVAGCPKLIAGYHVLHRLSVPSHSPYALCILTTIISRSADLSCHPAWIGRDVPCFFRPRARITHPRAVCQPGSCSEDTIRSDAAVFGSRQKQLLVHFSDSPNSIIQERRSP